MNTIELIKYLSPVAVLTIIWKVVEFYKNQQSKKNQVLRGEKMKVFNELHLVLLELKKNLKKVVFEINNSGGVELKNWLDSFPNENKITEIVYSEDSLDIKLKNLSLFKGKLSKEFKVLIGILSSQNKRLKKTGVNMKELSVEIGNIPMIGILTKTDFKSNLYRLSKLVNDVQYSLENGLYYHKNGLFDVKEFDQKLKKINTIIHTLEESMRNDLKQLL